MVSLNSETQVLASTGSTRRQAWGRITRRSAWPARHASATAASTCPLRMELRPARKVSEL